MTFPKAWKNGRAGGTPIEAASLIDLEERTSVDAQSHSIPLTEKPVYVTAQSAGGIAAWAPGETIQANQLRSNAGITYLCKETHVSGETFSGVGAKWEITAGSGAEFSCPPPTGVAATDTANVEACLAAAGAANGVASFTKPGTYKINKELVRPSTASVVIGPNTTLQGTAPATGECLLTDSKTVKTEGKSIVGGGTLDSNNVFAHALWCRYFGHQLVLGVKPKNSLEDDCILGDNTATGSSQEPILTPAFLIQRSSGAVPVGHSCLWIQNASDGREFGVVTTGQETGITVDSGGWRFVGTHPVGAGFAMQVGIADNTTATEYYGLNLDTPTPGIHAGATGEAATATITDAAILANHKGRPVSGANIPAESFVGTVTPGVSFILVSSTGVEVKPTGAVAGITLAGVGLLQNGSASKVVGGKVFVSSTYGVDAGCFGIVFAPFAAVSSGDVSGFSCNGSTEFRVTQIMGGKLTPMTWRGLIQKNFVTEIASSKLAASSVIAEAIATGAVTEPKLAAEAVASGKVKPASSPAAGAEGSIVVGTTGVGRKRSAAIKGNGAITKFIFTHGLETREIVASVLTATFEEPVTALAKVIAISLSEAELVFTVAPGAGVVNHVAIVG